MTAPSSLVEVLRRHAETRPDSVAVTLDAGPAAEHPALSYGALYACAARLADDLRTVTPPGERALLVFPTSLEFVVAYLACLMAGVVAVPLMPPRRNASHDASAAIIADCLPATALCLPADAEPDARLRRQLDAAGVTPIGVALSDLPRDRPYLARTRNDLAFLQYTSGSTSTPKGVMVSHGNLLANLQMIRDRLGNHAGSTHVGWIPLYHDMGLIMNLLQPLYLGAKSVLMMPSGFMLRPLNWLRAIHAHGAEVAAAPNFAYDLCVDRFRPEQMDGVNLGGWKIAINGAEPVRASTLERFAKTFAPYGFDATVMHPSFGLAEATLMVTSGRRGVPARLRKISGARLLRGKIAEPEGDGDVRTLVGCGFAVEGLSLAIVDPETRRRTPSDAVGEVWVRGASVTDGYWRRPGQSVEMLGARIEAPPEDRCSAGPWLRTGDLGHLDGDGELYLVGRIKDVLIIRGVNHHPQDIEATAVASHPALRRDHGAVFGFVGDDGLEQVVLIQEIKRSHRGRSSSREIIAAIRAAVVGQHDIAFHTIILIQPGSLPKTTSGKIQRSLARERWMDGALELWQEEADR